MWKWLSRCVPGLSLLLLIALLCLAFPDAMSRPPDILPWSRNHHPPPTTPHGNGPPRHPMPLSLTQKTFLGYTLLVHFNAFTFVCRLAQAFSRMLKETRAVLRRRPSSQSSSCTPSFCDSPMMTPSISTEHPICFDLGSLEDGKEGEVIHAIILPNYSDDLGTLQTTLRVLAYHPRAATQYEVFLAMEQKEITAPEKAATLISTFQERSRDISGTFHPAGLAGEISGMGSNVAWAAKHIVETRTEDTVDCRDVIITVKWMCDQVHFRIQSPMKIHLTTQVL